MKLGDNFSESLNDWNVQVSIFENIVSSYSLNVIECNRSKIANFASQLQVFLMVSYKFLWMQLQFIKSNQTLVFVTAF